MSDLVKRLRDMAEYRNATRQDWTREMTEAADRIEQLERELELYKESSQHSLVSEENLRDQVAAEKALADRLYEDGITSSRWDFPCYAAYRKARGL